MRTLSGRNIEDNSGNLVKRLQLREPEAMADLYDLYGRVLYVVIVRIVHNPSVAEDLVQETFLRAWNRAEQLKSDCNSVGPWLVTIARHCALDYRKSWQAQISSDTAIEDADFPAVTMDLDILESDRARIIAQAFEGLSKNQQRVIQLSFYEGLSQAAIAEQLHQPLGTVKGWARSALARLRGKLDPHLIDLKARH